MSQKQLSSSEIYTMKKFLNPYVNQQRFYGKKNNTDHTSLLNSMFYRHEKSYDNIELRYVPVEKKANIFGNEKMLEELKKQEKQEQKQREKELRKQKLEQKFSSLPQLNQNQHPSLMRYQKMILKNQHLNKQNGSLPRIKQYYEDEDSQMSKIKQFLANKQKHVIVDDGVRLNHNSLIAYSKFLRKEEDNDEEDEDEE